MNEGAEKRPGEGGGDSGWERRMLTELASESLAERRRARRWTVAFRFAVLAYLVALPLLYLPLDWSFGGNAQTAVVDIEGVIKQDAPANADDIAAGIRAAFADENTRAVLLRINSPGGSAVQAAQVNDEIRRLRKAHPGIPVYAVIGDIGASGAYYIASAAERIYAAPASLVGSIGVVMPGFGFVDAMHKLGVERRLLTAGKHKGLLDPFSPLREDEREHVKGILEQVHEQFIDAVRRGRGDRLHETPDLFSGLVWSGSQALDLGLVDGFGSASSVAREVVGAERLVDFTVRAGLIERIGNRIGASLVDMLRAPAVDALYLGSP